MKTCKTCGETKDLDSFAKDNRARGERSTRGGQGVASSCKRCYSERRKPGLAAQRLEMKSLAEKGLKRCTKCDQVKENSEYNVRRASPDGLMQKCKECCKEYATTWRAENPDNFKQYYAEKKLSLQKKYKEWREANPEQRAEYMAKWGKENAPLVAEKNMRRHAGKIQATPKWANREKMVEFYKEAERLTRETGVPHHVDHIYPLNGKIVCGLHCEANLNVITQFENIQKLNRMPSEEYLKRCER